MSLSKNMVINNLSPTEFYLCLNYPNPFKDKTIIKFCIPYKTNVKLEVFDFQGNLIKKLLDEEKEAGTYEIEFFAEANILASHRNKEKDLSSKILLYKLTAGDYVQTKKMILLC